MASFPNWQQTVTLSETESNNVKQKKLIYWYKNKKDSPEILASVEEYMKMAYPAQRIYLNNQKIIPKVNDVKKNWPYLFIKPHDSFIWEQSKQR